MTRTHISAAMQSAVGCEFSRTVSFPISASDIRRWAVAVYYPEPAPERFWNESIVDEGGALIAPQELNPFAWMTSEGPDQPVDDAGSHNPDRLFDLLGIEGPGLKNQVNGGMTVDYGAPMRVGDVITSTTRLSDLSERTGRLGLMLFTTVETVFVNQDGVEVRRQRTTIIRY